ncbi:cleavage polyadenylation factor subunit fip1, partial [Conglomerata obtusa]
MSDSNLEFDISSTTSSTHVVLQETAPAAVFDVDLDGLEDKPWTKPGADITDFYNYGFDENMWKSYCAKQKEIREITGATVFQFKKG